MFLFKRRTSQLELTAVGLQSDGACVVRAASAGSRRPKIALLEFRDWDGRQPETKALARLAADFGLKRTPCTTVLSANEYKLLLTEAPDVKTDELKAAIRWRINDLIDFHINDATLDVFELPGATAPGVQRSMYAVVARKQVIQQRVDLLEAAGINLQVIDVPELAQRNIAALLPQDAEGVVLLSLNASGGLLTITKRAEIYMSRALDVGFEVLRQASNPTDYFDRIVLEVQRSLDYYDSHFRQAPLNSLVLAPMPHAIPGLLEHLNANLNVKATLMDLNEVAEFPRAVSLELQWKCLFAVGAALRQEGAAL